MSWVIGFCCGVIIIGVIADLAHKREVNRLEEKNETDRISYDCSLNLMKQKEVMLKQKIDLLEKKRDLEESFAAFSKSDEHGED